MTTTLRVRYDGRSLVPLDPVDLPQGEILEVDVHPAQDPPKGSSARIRQTLQSLPPLDAETAEEFNRAMASVKIKTRETGPFDDLTD